MRNMMIKTILAAFVVTFVPAFSAFAKNGNTVHQVSIRGMKFVPPTIEAAVGDEIVWKNDDIVPHTATGASFDSGSIAGGESWTLMVKKTGETPYKCAFHPTMIGSVKVSSKK